MNKSEKKLVEQNFAAEVRLVFCSNINSEILFSFASSQFRASLFSLIYANKMRYLGGN